MSMFARLRRFWLDVHLWIGAGLLVVLIPLSVTGSVLVWHDGLDRALYSGRYAVSGPVAQPPSAYAQAAQAAFGDRARLSQLRLPREAGDPVVAVGRIAGPPGPGGRPRTLNAWLDPADARVLDVAEPAKGPMMILHQLHGTLLIPDIGRKVVGWLGWAMFVSCATGLWLWWPRGGGFLKGLRWRRGSSQLFNLHHQVGFWVCLPLAVLSLTGVYISFPQTSHALVGAPPPPARNPARNAPPVEHTRLTVAEAVEAAMVTSPGARVTAVNLPTTAGRTPAWRIELGGRTVQVADATGQVEAARGGGNAPDPISRAMREIHDGTDTGLVWRTIITLAGVAPALLGVTGVIMWLRRRARRQALATA